MTLAIRLQGAELVAAVDDLIVQINAQQIFNSVFKSASLEVGPGGRPLLPDDIEFSRFPAQIFLALVDSGGTSPGIRPSLLVRGHAGPAVSLLSFPPNDHILLDKQWYPFDPVDYRCVKELWEIATSAGIANLTLPQYVELTSRDTAKTYLLDKTNSLQASLPSLIPKLGTEAPSGLAKDIALYPYQIAGWRWLKALRQMKLGALLADEMGLGKTLQIIALLADDPSTLENPTLIIVPGTLIPNWERELSKFAPGLEYFVHRGSSRISYFKDFAKYKIVLTTYDLVWSDLSLLDMINWSNVILDEAHLVKNHETKRFRAIRSLKKDFAVAITGTPIQNSMKDSWSLFDFILPNYCGSLDEFMNQYSDTESDALHLAPKLTPFMLRRVVKEVARDLPPLIEIPQPLEMTEIEAVAYENYRQNAISDGANSFALIMPLRQLCCHPRLIDPRWENVSVTQSNKFTRLLEILLEIKQSNEKCLVFTSFKKMARLIASHVPVSLKLDADVVNGDTPPEERQRIIDDFNAAEGARVMVLSPQVGAVGLNIQSANHVIHYNLEWNPAVEDQATARSYRRGQTRPVTVHRLFYQNTLEEVINARIDLKRGLINSAVRGVKGDDADLALALSLSPTMRDV